MNGWQIAVLDERQLILIAPAQLTERGYALVREQINRELTGWHPIVFSGPGEVRDLRGDPELARMANELRERLGPSR